MSNVANLPGVDPTLPNVPIILGGVERHLVFDYNAVVHAEKASGVDLLKAIISDINATQLRGLLWAALLKENSKLTLDQVGSWITPRNAPGIHQSLILAWFGSITEPKGDEPAGEEQGQATPNA